MEQPFTSLDTQPAFGRWERVQQFFAAIGVADVPEYVYDRSACIGDSGPFGGSEDLPASTWPDSGQFDADRAAASYARRIERIRADLHTFDS